MLILFYGIARIFYQLADIVTYNARVDGTLWMIIYTGMAYSFGILRLQNNLKKFLIAFEEKYQADIEQWSGNLDLFSDIDELIESYFGVYIPKR